MRLSDIFSTDQISLLNKLPEGHRRRCVWNRLHPDRDPGVHPLDEILDEVVDELAVRVAIVPQGEGAPCS